jgi:hypothetical protein
MTQHRGRVSVLPDFLLDYVVAQLSPEKRHQIAQAGVPMDVKVLRCPFPPGRDL